MRCWRGILVSGFGFTWNMSWRSWSDEFIERVVVFHVKHCGVGCLGALLGIGDGAFNGVFHVKHWLFLLWMGWCFGF